MNDLIAYRQKLHSMPELSGNEINTSKFIRELISKYSPSETIQLADTGLAFVFTSNLPGKTTMIRADMDALPIQEENTIDYKSTSKGVAHLCGHDGHSAILIGLAKKISENMPKKGKIVLLFQPAEETGEGAKAILEDRKFSKIEPDYIFGLHNIPGIELHKIVYKENSFAAASKGMTIKLFGKTSHAGEPEKGISPTNAIGAFIKEIQIIKEKLGHFFNDKILLTIVNIQLGEIAFGTSPGYAEIRITLRAFNNEDLETLSQIVEKTIGKIVSNEGLKIDISYCEIFPATVNHPECINFIYNSVAQNNYIMEELSQPFNWSEDFGYFTQKYKGGFFGLGAGVKQPALHNPNYNFPDELIETGVNIFNKIIHQINY
ncbi:MAG: amidohydrolase [Salinivirgaceae bacterium]|nr:amidohydrolase [Salinivirgaceae bacterium]